MDRIDNYYKRKEKIIVKLYDTLTKWACEELEPHISDTRLNKFEMAVKAEYSSVISRLPYIGGRKNAFTGIIVINGWYVCVYRALREDMPIEVVAYINRMVSKKLFYKMPKFIGEFLGGLAFKKIGRNYLTRQALMSEERAYEANFVYTFDSENSEFRFTECAVHKYYEEEGAEALKPYCNFADPLYSARFKMGCNAEHTFAQCKDVCILSYNRQSDTKTPDNIKEMITKAESYLSNKNT